MWRQPVEIGRGVDGELGVRRVCSGFFEVENRLGLFVLGHAEVVTMQIDDDVSLRIRHDHIEHHNSGRSANRVNTILCLLPPAIPPSLAPGQSAVLAASPSATEPVTAPSAPGGVTVCGAGAS
jgi:hypothetical protein